MRALKIFAIVTFLFGAFIIVSAEERSGQIADPKISSAIISRTISYQGILKDDSGNPVPDDTYDMTFRIYRQPSGGSALWTSSLSAVATTDGYFTTELGPIDLPFDTTYYLSIQVSPDPEMTQRQKLTMSAYSAVTDSANYSFDIADNSVTSSKIVNSTIQFQDIGQNGANNGQIMKWNGSAWEARNDSVGPNSGWTDNGSMVILTSESDKVGIGTATPAKKLDVYGDVQASGNALIGHECYGNYYGQIAAGFRDSIYTLGFSSICGGERNIIRGFSSNWSFIGSGLDNVIDSTAPWAFIGGGRNNIASDNYATVGGGVYNRARGYASVVCGGGGYYEVDSNSAQGAYSVIAGGAGNVAYTDLSFIGGGWFNRNAGQFSAIPNGERDTITSAASYTMVYGEAVYMNSPYRVAFFDGANSGGLGLNRDDRDGGINYPIHVGTNASNGFGAYLTAGGVWTNGSSRTFKENGRPATGQDLLDKIANLPVDHYNFINSNETHIGPYAEDFVATFDVGVVRESDGKRDDQYLAASDVAGVALAGVKELLNSIDQLKEENSQLKKQNADFERRLSELENVPR